MRSVPVATAFTLAAAFAIGALTAPGRAAATHWGQDPRAAAGDRDRGGPGTPARTLALLIGIDEYLQPAPGRGPELGRLQGTQNDIARVQELLQRRFGFAREDIATLLGPKATHEAIVRTFHDHLIAKAGRDTLVVFWFSGHGSRVPDASKKDKSEREDYGDPYDDSILAYDSRAGERFGSFDFTDDELHSLLAALPSRNVLVVTDCCHSGGLLRGAGRPGTGTRAAGDGEQPLAWNAVERFWPRGVPFLDDDRGEVAKHAVHIAACGSLQEAGEYEIDGHTYGTLTWFLTGVLAEVDPQESWRAVAETTRARVAGCGTRRDQLVLWRGPVERAVLGGLGKPVRPGYLARRLGTGSLLIEAGRIHGIVENTTLRIFDLDDQERGMASVHRSRPWSCDADWISTGDVPADVALRAVPAGGLQGRAPLCLRLEEGIDPRLLEKCPWGVQYWGKDCDYVLARAGEQLQLRKEDGTFTRTFPADKLQDTLFQVHCFRSLWEGIAQPGRFRLELAVAPASAARRQQCMWESELAACPEAARVRWEPGSQRALVGAPHMEMTDPCGTGGFVELTVTNRSEEDVYVAVLSVAENHVVNVIWGKDRNNVLSPGASQACLVEVGPTREWQVERPMLDRYVAIATPRFADFTPFQSRVVPEVTRGGGRGDTELPAFLAGALCGETTRGGGGPAAGAWGIGWLDLQLLTPERFGELTAAKR